MKPEHISAIILAIHQVLKEHIDTLDEADVKALKKAKKELQKVINNNGNLPVPRSESNRNILTKAIGLITKIFTGSG